MVSCISLTKALTLASLSSDSPPLPSQPKPKPPPPPRLRSTRLAPQKTVEPNRPSVAEIERAIGAGVFRDASPSDPEAKSMSFFDTVLSKSIGKTEGSLERTLRETGEWVNTETERAARSSGRLCVLYNSLMLSLSVRKNLALRTLHVQEKSREKDRNKQRKGNLCWKVLSNLSLQTIFRSIYIKKSLWTI
ncbi:hypothetical protein Ancab_018417 [Ancistrocladus abbreviatus]